MRGLLAGASAGPGGDTRCPVPEGERDTIVHECGQFGLGIIASAAAAGVRMGKVKELLEAVGMSTPDLAVNTSAMSHAVRLACEGTADYFMNAAYHFMHKRERGDKSTWATFDISKNVSIYN